ncbi:MAG: DUF2059 domain-containing protein [Sphingomonadales bacterium]|nr:MAG: DUF2059 domain-containing protein [Sphingomonadales bacterium]
MRTIFAAALACAIPFAAQAQDAPKLVATGALPDPARLEIARHIADRLLPPGAFVEMMRTTMDKMSGGVMDQMMSQMSLADIAKAAGASEDKVARLGTVNLKQVMVIVDPAFEERSRITMKVMADEMVVLMTDLEPEYRSGIAEALATRFTLAQLQELDRFFSTPTGSAYASQSLTLYTDPAMMRRMDTLMPRIMKAMPGIMQKTIAATAHLPKQGDFKTMSKEQIARLSALLGAGEDSK